MPPKKKDDKKKDVISDAKIAEAEEERELVEKELVIGYLRSKLNRYQDNGDRLSVDVVRLQDELETQKLNLRDINEFLTNELKARSLTTSALEGKVSELNGLLEEVRKSHETALSRLRSEKDREIERLEGIVREHDRKARITQEFLDRKEAMEAELQGLKETLARKSKEFEQRVTDMDRQHIQDREKWKREMAHKIKETKLQMMKLTDNQLEMTTKRTIMENEQMSIELSYQSRQTEKLLNKNSKLMDENAELRRQLELSQQTEQELARRNNLYQKTIKTLLSKLQDQGYAAAESEAVVGQLDARLGDLAAHLHLAQLTAEEKAAEAEQLKDRLEARASEAATLVATTDEAARFLLACLADVREAVVTLVRREDVSGAGAGGGRPGSGARPGSGGGGGGGGSADGSVSPSADITVLPGRLDELSSEQRERVLAFLLERLAAFAASKGLPGLPMAPNSTASAAAGANGGGGGGGGGGNATGQETALPAAPIGGGPGGSRLGTAGGGGGGETSSGVTLPPIPSFNRRQYGGLHGHGPLSYSSPTPLSAGSVGVAAAGEWGAAAAAGGGGLPGSRLGRGVSRDQEHSTTSLTSLGVSAGGVSVGGGAPSSSAAALPAVSSSLDAGPAAGVGLGYGGSVVSAVSGGGVVGGGAVVSNGGGGLLSGSGVPVFGPAAGAALGLGYSASEVMQSGGGGYAAGGGVIGGAAYGSGGGHGDVEEALSKVLSEVRPWGKRSSEQPLTTAKHSGTFLRRGQGKAVVKGL